jgi:hypothetical protein
MVTNRTERRNDAPDHRFRGAGVLGRDPGPDLAEVAQGEAGQAQLPQGGEARAQARDQLRFKPMEIHGRRSAAPSLLQGFAHFRLVGGGAALVKQPDSLPGSVGCVPKAPGGQLGLDQADDLRAQVQLRGVQPDTP